MSMGPKFKWRSGLAEWALCLSLGLLFAGCSPSGEAGRVANALAVLEPLNGTHGTLPTTLKCNAIHQWKMGSGNFTVTGTSNGTTATVTFTIAVTFAAPSSYTPAEAAYNCIFGVAYAIDSNNQLSGPGTLVTCPTSCKFKGSDVSCEDLTKSLAENVCTKQ